MNSNEISAQEFICAVIARLVHEKIELPIDIDIWHEVLYALKYNEGRPFPVRCVREMRFDHDDRIARADDISSAFTAFMASGSMEVSWPSGRRSFSPELVDLWYQDYLVTASLELLTAVHQACILIKEYKCKYDRT